MDENNTASQPKSDWSFSGRARRSEYWKKVLKYWAIYLLIGFPLVVVGAANDSGLLSLLGVVVMLICSLAMWPIAVRRLHDRNMSGWWLLWFFLLGLLPFIGFIATLVQLIIIGFLDGTPGQNKYGPDPKGRVVVMAGAA